jgi:Rrf2 family protein
MKNTKSGEKILMRLTTKSRYGTRLILDIALNSQDSPVRLREISKRQNISLKYLEKLVRILKSADIVKSVRGPYGGYLLAKPMEEITIGDIVRALEGSETITDCTDRENICGVCSRAGECLTQCIWMEASEAMFSKLDSFRVDKLIQNSGQIIKNK